MSGAILGWGVDLGYEDSAESKLFAVWAGDSVIASQWSIYCYGREFNRSALMLERSLEVSGSEEESYSVSDFFSVNLGPDGFPVMASQPNADELNALREIMKDVGATGNKNVSLILDVLMLPTEL